VTVPDRTVTVPSGDRDRFVHITSLPFLTVPNRFLPALIVTVTVTLP
jgi:hypothetical protein